MILNIRHRSSSERDDDTAKDPFSRVAVESDIMEKESIRLKARTNLLTISHLGSRLSLLLCSVC